MKTGKCIERAAPRHAPELTRIAQAAKAALGYRAEWLEAWEPALTLSSAYVRSHPVYLAIDEETIAGFYAIGRQLEQLWLDHLWVLPDRQRKGFGTSLLRHAIETAKSEGADALWIESDPHAAAFYTRNGAVQAASTWSWCCGEPRELPVFQLKIPRPEKGCGTAPVESC